ncbi:MAG TPA: hypothetical protein VIM92_05685 [Rhodanobacteraceae bacterium]
MALTNDVSKHGCEYQCTVFKIAGTYVRNMSDRDDRAGEIAIQP